MASWMVSVVDAALSAVCHVSGNGFQETRQLCAAEAELIAEFTALHGALPFANRLLGLAGATAPAAASGGRRGPQLVGGPGLGGGRLGHGAPGDQERPAGLRARKTGGEVAGRSTT
ncbi:hypothetical protein [Streptomyces sp. NPDC060035]|uniref:hypothetical protein n=1 Tax=Streptomyces sp. NPDC060035 TaxID=3347044 RepID=UPI0036C24D91